MRHHHVLLGLVLLMILIPVPNATAQIGSRLIPNQTRSNEHLWGYSTGLYYANLTAGSWSIVVSSSSFWGMSFAITVLGADTAVVLAESDRPGQSGASLEFTLEEASLVNVRVEETAGEGGYYSVGVYNGIHALFAIYGIWLIVLPVLVVSVIVAIAYVVKSRGRRFADQDVRVEAPKFAIPESYRQRPETSDIRTVRLPAKCPSCGASLSQEDIDWTGPLEEKCNYCGSVVRARLEKL